MKNLRQVNWLKPGIALAFLCLVACNNADKKSNLEKDSVGGDRVMPNKVGGSETYETKLDEEAADHLKQITNFLLMEYHLLVLNQDKTNKKPSAALAQLMNVNQTSFKRIEAYAAEKRVILPSILLAEQQVTLDSLKSLPPADASNGRLRLLKANGTALLEELQLAADNREQDFKTLMKDEYGYQQQKYRLLDSL